MLKTRDEVSYLKMILKELGAGKIISFDDRLKTQKIQYLSQSLGITPAYPYRLYIRGPYSQELADELFHCSNVNPSDFKEFVTPEIEDSFLFLKELIRGRSSRKLELLATIHWLIKEAEFPLEEAKRKLKNIKKATKDEVNITLELLNKINKNEAK